MPNRVAARDDAFCIVLKQVVGYFASAVALAVVALILGVLVRLSWGQQEGNPAPDD